MAELLPEFSSSDYLTDTKLSRVKPIPYTRTLKTAVLVVHPAER